jgi:hypothetical protein
VFKQFKLKINGKMRRWLINGCKERP